MGVNMNEIPGIAYLEIIFGPNKGDMIAIEKTPWLMGRHPSCDYPVDNEHLSREHVRIIVKDGRWFLINLKSTNGTFLNQRRLENDEEKVLVDEDEIQLGKVITFRFKDPTKTVSETQNQMMVPGLWINAENGDVFVQMKMVTPRFSREQFSLLLMLFQEPGKLFTREQIISKLWPDDDPAGITDDAITTQIYRIRERLRTLDSEHEYIESVRGEGRKFVQRPYY
jgi:DNA-binding winged helix-turn-helix (wHTH) protein